MGFTEWDWQFDKKIQLKKIVHMVIGLKDETVVQCRNVRQNLAPR